MAVAIIGCVSPPLQINKNCLMSSARYRPTTMAKTKIIYSKNVRAKVAMDFTSDEYSAPIAIEKNQMTGSRFGAIS